MTTIDKSSFVIPELLADKVSTTFAGGLNALVDIPGIVKNPSLPTSARGGDTLKVPYFGNIGEFEDVAEDVALTPVALTSSSETATVTRSGKAITITKWAEMAAAYEDPYAELASQMVAGAARRMDSGLISVAKAAYSGGSPGDTAGLVTDISGTGNGLIGYDAVIDAILKWGDEQDDMLSMAVHSKVWGDLIKLKDANGRPYANETLQADGRLLRTFAGMRLKVSNKLTATAGVYPSLILKPGALVAWFNPSPSVEVDKDILKDNKVAAVNMYHITYRYKHLPGSTLPGVAVLKTK